MKYIPYGRQYVDKKDILEVSKSLKKNLITTGSYVKKLETKISNFFGSNYSVTCSSGTAGLHLAFLALNLCENDVVVMPAINFIASYSMAKKLKAKIYLADVDAKSGQMTPETFNKCVEINKIKKIKAIVTMYMGGFPENVENFHKIKKKFKCFLIEDACHAMGARYYSNKKLQFIGSCKHSDLAVFSLHPVKTITAGEGGVVTTNNKIFYQKMISLRSHGLIKKKNQHWKYNISNLGYNYRLSDLNCALALSQLSKIFKFINFRNKIYKNYQNNFKKIKSIVTFYNYNKKNKPSYHLSIISINFHKTKVNKEKFLLFLKKEKIICQYHYLPIYKFNIYDKKEFISNFPGAEYYHKNAVSLPIFYNLKISLQKKIINKINFFILKNIKNFF